MKRTVELGKKGNNLPRTRAEGPKKKKYPKRPQEQGELSADERARRAGL